MPFIRSPGLAHLTSTWGCAWPALLGSPGLSGLPTLPLWEPLGTSRSLSEPLSEPLGALLIQRPPANGVKIPKATWEVKFTFRVLPQRRRKRDATWEVEIKPMSLEIAVRAIQPLADQSQAERSEALLREAQLPPKAAGAEGAPELREGFKQKLGFDSTTCDSAVASQQPESAGTRAQHVLDISKYCIVIHSCDILQTIGSS